MKKEEEEEEREEKNKRQDGERSHDNLLNKSKCGYCYVNQTKSLRVSVSHPSSLIPRMS